MTEMMTVILLAVVYRADMAGLQAGVSCRYENTPGRHLQCHRFLHVEILHSVACTATTSGPQGF